MIGATPATPRPCSGQGPRLRPGAAPGTPSPTDFTVTDARTALHCPRLFVIGRTWGGSTRFVGPDERRVPVGRLFHEAVERLAAVATPDRDLAVRLAAAPPDALLATLLDVLCDRALHPILDRERPRLAFRGAEVLSLWRAVEAAGRHLARLLAGNRPFFPPADLIRRTFLDAEMPVFLTLADQGGEIRVAGRLDALLYDASARQMQIVEWKTLSSASKDVDRLQVALYHWMVRESRGFEAESVLHYVLPGDDREVFSSRDLRAWSVALPERLLAMRRWAAWREGDPPPPPAATPALCEVCPQRDLCRRLFGESAARPAGPEAAGDLSPGGSGGQDGLAAIVRILGAHGLAVSPAGTVSGPTFVRHLVEPRPGIRVTSITARRLDLKVQLALAEEPLVGTDDAGHVTIDVIRRDRETVPLRSLLRGPEASARRGRPVFPLGVGIDGKARWIDLACDASPHLLVAGTTGSGKTELLRSAIVSLAWALPPADLRLHLIDPKIVSFAPLKGLPHVEGAVMHDVGRAVERLAQLVEEMDRRYRSFEEAGVKDILAYRQAGRRLPWLVVVFDEYADFVATRESKEATEESIHRIAAKGRAAGVHLVVATQRPDRTVVGGIVKANLVGRVALKVASGVDSQIILGCPDAKDLAGRGDLLCRAGDGGGPRRLQAPYVPEAELPAILGDLAGGPA